MSLLIKNGLVYDGRGQPPFKSDILIHGKQIAGIGEFSKYKADRVIDAANMLVMPGFIDINPASDRYLNILTDPYQEQFIAQGITTVIGGGCGSSLAPLLDSSLASIRKWGSVYFAETNINWSSFAEFLNVIKKRGVGVNFGSLVGHATIKRAITGEKSRDLTHKELEFFKNVLKAALKEGAFGFSTGFEYAYARQTPQYEILELAHVTAAEKGIYTAGLRHPEDKIKESFEEVADIARQTGVNTEISHLQPYESTAKEYEQMLCALEEKTHNTRINFDCYPYEVTKIPVYRLLPDWMQRESFEEIARTINAPHAEQLIIDHLKIVSRKDITIAHIPPELAFLKGKTIQTLAQEFKTTPAKTVLKLMRLSSLKAVCLYCNVSRECLNKFMCSDASLIASNGIHLASPDYQPFTEFIKWAAAESNLPLEKAVAKCSSIPAVKYGITKRGSIKENYYADILILQDTAVRDVLINGEIVLKNKMPKKLLKGEVLRHG